MAVTLRAALFKGAVARFLRQGMPLVQRARGALLLVAGTFLALVEEPEVTARRELTLERK